MTKDLWDQVTLKTERHLGPPLEPREMLDQEFLGKRKNLRVVTFTSQLLPSSNLYAAVHMQLAICKAKPCTKYVVIRAGTLVPHELR